MDRAEHTAKQRAVRFVKSLDIIYYTAALLMPSILLFILYNRNIELVYMPLDCLCIIVGLLAIFGLLLFCIFKKITDSIEGALPASGAIWLSFWLYSRIKTFVSGFFFSITDLFLILTIVSCIIIAALCFRMLKSSFAYIRPAFNVLAICLIGLFIVNLLPIINHEIVLRSNKARVLRIEEDSKPYKTKEDFYQNSLNPGPNIVWIHADGMMSLETAESYWDNDFSWFGNELEDRGFIRDENTLLKAGNTRVALTAMLSPTFYDSWLEETTDRYNNRLHELMNPLITDELTDVGLDYYRDILPGFETMRAFETAGYNITVYNMGPYMSNYYSSRNREITEGVSEQSLYNRFIQSDFPEILRQTTPLRFPDSPYDTEINPETLGLLLNNDKTPQFIMIGLKDTHVSEFPSFDPLAASSDHTAIHAYPAAYKSMIEKIISLVTVIQKEDPGAVIIVQGDHGFHSEITREYLFEQGYSDAQVSELFYSVINAVYIPEKYGGLNEPIHPLNISRELVNRFIGENYVLLSIEEIKH